MCLFEYLAEVNVAVIIYIAIVTTNNVEATVAKLV